MSSAPGVPPRISLGGVFFWLVRGAPYPDLRQGVWKSVAPSRSLSGGVRKPSVPVEFSGSPVGGPHARQPTPATESEIPTGKNRPNTAPNFSGMADATEQGHASGFLPRRRPGGASAARHPLDGHAHPPRAGPGGSGPEEPGKPSPKTVGGAQDADPAASSQERTELHSAVAAATEPEHDRSMTVPPLRLARLDRPGPGCSGEAGT